MVETTRTRASFLLRKCSLCILRSLERSETGRSTIRLCLDASNSVEKLMIFELFLVVLYFLSELHSMVSHFTDHSGCSWYFIMVYSPLFVAYGLWSFLKSWKIPKSPHHVAFEKKSRSNDLHLGYPSIHLHSTVW